MQQTEKLNHSEHPIEQQLDAQELLFAQLAERLKSYRILSTLRYHKVPFWYENVHTLEPCRESAAARLTQSIGIKDPSMIWRLLTQAGSYDLVLLTGGERGDLLYLALAGAMPWMRTPHIIVDAHWQPASGFAGLMQKLILRIGRRLTLQVQPHTAEETRIHHQYFGIPPEISVVVPWSTSLIGYEFPTQNGDSIVTGGLSYRDYKTFFEAIAPLPYPVEVGLPHGFQTPHANGIDPRRVRIHNTLSNEEYMRKIATCRVFAMPMEPGLLRSAGDQSILNAMYFRKIVIVTDSIVARAYIRHGENGFIVPESDPIAWREAIDHAMKLSEAAYDRIAGQAEFDAKVRFNEYFRIYSAMQAALDAYDATLTSPGKSCAVQELSD
jgi:glycosyltransferase involved in cell wall biosynthesis